MWFEIIVLIKKNINDNPKKMLLIIYCVLVDLCVYGKKISPIKTNKDNRWNMHNKRKI